MSRKSHDSTDELLRALRASLDEDLDVGTGDASADEETSSRTASDEEIAAFDSYMAALLGEVVPEEPSSSKKNAKKTTKPKKKKSPKKAVAPLPSSEGDAIVMSDVDAPEESQLSISAPDAEGTEPVYEADSLANDSQVEISAELLGAQNPTIDSVYVTEEETADTSARATGEQLSIPSESFGAAVREPEDASVQDIPPVEEGYLPVEGLAPVAPEQEDASPEDEKRPLREGDIIMDAEDETPVVLEVAPSDEKEDTPPAIERTLITPVASPLDAARSANARAADRLSESAEPPRPKQSPLDTLATERAGSRGNVSPIGGASFGRASSRERGMSDEDVELLLELGYENNLSQKLGAQRVEDVKHRCLGDESAKNPIRDVYACDGEEYAGHKQDKEIRRSYRAHDRAAMARMILTVLLTVVIGLSDLLFVLFETPPGPLAKLPTSGLYGGIGLVMLLLAAACCFTCMKRGVVNAMKYSLTPASLTTLVVVITLLYDVLGLFDARCGVLLNLPAAFALSALAIGEYISIKNQRIAFAAVNSRARKIALYDMEPKRKKVIRGGHIVKIINDDADRILRRVRRTERIGGYFRRTGEPTKRYRALPGLMMTSVLCSVVLAVMALLIKEDLRLSATVLVLALQMTLPLSALIAYVYPFWLTCTRLAKRGCSIIGDSAVDEYAKDSILLFDDTEMFRSKSSTEITIRGGGDTRKYIRYAKRLFKTLGGTLSSVTTSDLSEEVREDRVEILRVLEQGIEARIDGRVRVLAGTSEFMMKNGIRVPSDSAELLVRRHVESSILYLAFDGKLRLGYEIDYRISGRFEQIADQLDRAGTSVAVESSDPCIHAELLARSRDPKLAPIRVIKPLHFEKNDEAEVIDSGVVATKNARDIAHAVLACHKIAENDRLIRGIQYVATLIGALLCGALMMFDFINPYVSAIAATAQVAFLTLTLFASRKNMLNEQDHKSVHDKRN